MSFLFLVPVPARRHGFLGSPHPRLDNRVFLLASATALAQQQLDPVFTSYDAVKLADGIYAFISPQATGAFVSGNSVLIVGSDGALVVDSGHVPSLTRRMITDITRPTNKPVRSLVCTHWHPDHVSGNALYREQWPGVRDGQHPRHTIRTHPARSPVRRPDRDEQVRGTTRAYRETKGRPLNDENQGPPSPPLLLS